MIASQLHCKSLGSREYVFFFSGPLVEIQTKKKNLRLFFKRFRLGFYNYAKFRLFRLEVLIM